MLDLGIERTTKSARVFFRFAKALVRRRVLEGGQRRAGGDVNRIAALLLSLREGQTMVNGKRHVPIVRHGV